MNKAQIVYMFAQTLTESGTNKSPKALATALMETLCYNIAQALVAGDEVVLPGVGKIKPKSVAAKAAKPARIGRNPRTGEPVRIEAKPAQPASRSIKVRPAKELLALLNA